MTTTKQRKAARRNIKKAAAAARSKRTIAHLPKKGPDRARQAGGEGRETAPPETRVKRN